MKNKLIITLIIFSTIFFTSCRICCNGNPEGKHYNARNLTNK